jgi:hypothetical protein
VQESNKNFVKAIDEMMELSGILIGGFPSWKIGLKTKKVKEFLRVHHYIIKY